jgi:uncharacterized repeat protein (TIGR03803 family)
MGKLNWIKKACGIFLLCTMAAIALPAQTTGNAPAAPIFTVLHNFDLTDGLYPQAGLVQAANGNFYGTTSAGGLDGTVFKITPSGTLTTLHSFDSTDGGNPYAGLVQGIDGNFYGTTVGNAIGFCPSCGTVFKITPSGTLTTLHSFDFTDGANPYGALVQGFDGNFYGTTAYGGANSSCNGGVGCGTVFKITPSGTLTTLHSFDGTDGTGPSAGLVQAADGSFYGTTYSGGTNGSSCGGGCGTVFRITPDGRLTTLHSFDFTDGYFPFAGLVQGNDGNFYGTTVEGGGGDNCSGEGCGTVFRITPSGTLTTLHRFIGTDGDDPYAGLVQGTDGNFYGTTYGGGTHGIGSVFEITPSGTLTTLHSLSETDGYFPIAGLVQGTDGNFYGTAAYGGATGSCDPPYGCGTVFSLSVGLGPFVETLPEFGKVGTPVHILGTDLTGTTSVTFNGTPATFTVITKTLIFTNVPAGATTGTVQVVIPSGTLSSNAPFQVK